MRNNTRPLCLAATAGTELVGANKGSIIILETPIGLYGPLDLQIIHELSWVRVPPIAQYPIKPPPSSGSLGRFKS